MPIAAYIRHFTNRGEYFIIMLKKDAGEEQLDQLVVETNIKFVFRRVTVKIFFAVLGLCVSFVAMFYLFVLVTAWV